MEEWGVLFEKKWRKPPVGGFRSLPSGTCSGFGRGRGDTGAYNKMRLETDGKGCQRNFGYTSAELDALQKTLSAERLSTYVRRANGNRAKAIALYEHNTKVSESLFGVIRGLEVALRNSIHDVLRTNLGADDWYDKLPVPLLKEEKRCIRMAKTKITQRQKPVLPGRVVAELTFGFWTGLISKPYTAALWVPYLHKSFPNKRLGRKEAYGRLNEHRLLRNRIAHHECILHMDLREQHESLLQTVAWICPITADWVRRYSSFEHRSLD